MELLSMLSSGEIILILIPLLFLFIVVYAVIDIATHDFRKNDKIVWLLIAILIPVLGAFIYLSVGRFQKINMDVQSNEDR